MEGKSYNILVLGSGGREHALCWKLKQSPLLGDLYCASGNGGIAQEVPCVPAFATHKDLIEFCRSKDIALVVPGSEALLMDGVVDALSAAGVAAFGPSKAAAQLEGSKGFTKDLCKAHNIPTARYARFDKAAQAKAWAKAHGCPLVVKADGLAAGKGVLMAQTLAQAYEAIDAMLGGQFGDAGLSLVLEERLYGTEMSFFAICDGTKAIPFMTAQDYKRIGEQDTGLNTGGMGAICPAPHSTQALDAQVMARIITPTLEAMAAAGTPFRGVLYAGLMLCADGPYLIEYNVRFGDPECQAMLARMHSDVLPLLLAAAGVGGQRLADMPALAWCDEMSVLVVVATQGYPQDFETGTLIYGLDLVAREASCLFHAATHCEAGQWQATGGRVLNVVACEKSLPAARQRVYTALEQLDWPQGYYRRDIGAPTKMIRKQS